MDISRQACRLCLTITDFNISLFSSYCRKNKMLDKILVCLNLFIEETDYLTTICYKCAENVERHYDFIEFVEKTQTKLGNKEKRNKANIDPSMNLTRRQVTSYVREEVTDGDYTFAFLEVSKDEETKESNTSSPFFTYFSPPNMMKKLKEPCQWMSRGSFNDCKNDIKKGRHENKFKKFKAEKPKQHSLDLFESQSQDAEEPERRSLDRKLTPDENLFKRVRDKCFGRSNF